MWYKKGSEAKEALEKSEKVSKMLQEKNIPRLWLKVGEEASIVFVDDDAFWCEIHTIKIGNRFVDITCSSDIRPCPICLKEGRRPLGVTYFTVIDLRKFVTRDGRVVKYRKVLLPARRTLAKMIFDYKEKYGSLVGVKVLLKRFTETDPNCGIIVEVDKRADGIPKRYDLSSLGDEFTIPFDYEKILAPPTEEELKLIGYPLVKIGDIPTFDEDFVEEIEEEEEDDLVENIEKELEEMEEGVDELEEELEEEDLEELEEIKQEREEKSKNESKKRKK